MKRVVVALLMLLCASCATGRRGEGNRLFLAGDYAGAAVAYERTLADPKAAPANELLLLRAALAHALTEDPARDLGRSTELLRLLIERFPTSRYRASAMMILRLNEELRSMRATLTAERELRDAAIARSVALEQELLTATEGLQLAEKTAAERTQTIATLRREIERLQSDARAQEERIHLLELELFGLKEIDLGQADP